MTNDEIVKIFVIKAYAIKNYRSAITNDTTISHLWDDVFTQEDRDAVEATLKFMYGGREIV